jgi:hypothetical protein
VVDERPAERAPVVVPHRQPRVHRRLVVLDVDVELGDHEVENRASHVGLLGQLHQAPPVEVTADEPRTFVVDAGRPERGSGSYRLDEQARHDSKASVHLLDDAGTLEPLGGLRRVPGAEASRGGQRRTSDRLEGQGGGDAKACRVGEEPQQLIGMDERGHRRTLAYFARQHRIFPGRSRCFHNHPSPRSDGKRIPSALFRRVTGSPKPAVERVEIRGRTGHSPAYVLSLVGTEDDATVVVAAANAAWGTSMRLLYRCPVGAEGVYAVQDDAGVRFAFRYWAGGAPATGVFSEIHRRLDVLREGGVPIARLLGTGPVGCDYVEVAEWVDGSVPEDTTPAHVAAALDVTRLMRGAAIGDGPVSAWLLSSIDDEAVGFGRPARLLDAGPRGVALLRAAQANMREISPADLTASDIVHCDFGLGNMLFRGTSVTAVVDWSGCRDGSTAMDVLGLWWDLALHRQDTGCLAMVEQELSTSPPADVAAARCHHAVRSAAGAVGRSNEATAFALAHEQLAAM